jgi:hypothetical protein
MQVAFRHVSKKATGQNLSKYVLKTSGNRWVQKMTRFGRPIIRQV